MVYFRKVNINKTNNTFTIITTSAPLTNKAGMLAGIPVATRSQSNVVFGVLSLVDPETGKSMRADHPAIVNFIKKTNPGDALEGYEMSDNPVIDMETKEPTDMRWVEAV